MLKGKPPLFNGLVSGLGHPLIHLGYAYELNSREVAMEAMALAATNYDPDVSQYLDDEKWAQLPTTYTTTSPFEVLSQVHADHRLDRDFHSIGGDNLSKVFSPEGYQGILMEHWNAWTVTEPTASFEQSQRLAVALLISTAPSLGGLGYDFFLVHLLTTSHALRILLPFLDPAWHLPLLRQWWLITVAIYVAQARPAVSVDDVAALDLQGRGWTDVSREAVQGPHALDAHYVKAIRAIKEAAALWGDPDHWYLKAAVKFAYDFAGWAGFPADVHRETSGG